MVGWHRNSAFKAVFAAACSLSARVLMSPLLLETEVGNTPVSSTLCTQPAEG